VWLIGLAILALKGWWWPGILVLVAISTLVEAAFPREEKEKADNAEEIPGNTGQSATTYTAPAPMASNTPRLDLLPTNCPRCGAPLHGVDVKWTSDRSADCPFCGSHLPLRAE
jgi:hypothetical protein